MEKRKFKSEITTGVIWKQILYFFFPILFGTFFQQLYNTVDAIIVGQFLGKEALAAVGSNTAVIINLLIGFFMGLASGASVVLSQRYGAQDKENVDKIIHTAIAMSLIGGIAIMLAGLFLSDWALRVLGTPDDIMPYASTYIKIFFIGTIPMILYNIVSGIFRAVGDSKRPLFFLIIASIVNTILDLLFVAVFKMGIEGAALATIIAILVSCILSFVYLKKAKEIVDFKFRKIRIHYDLLKKMLRIGFPSAIQSILYTLSNMIILSSINALGTDTVAAWAAYGKLDSMFWMIINAFGISITTFAGQNYGADKYDRVKKGIWTTLGMTAIASVFLSVFFCIFGRYGLMLFTTDTEVLNIGMQMILIISPLYITFIAIEILSGAIRGTGKVLVPTLICLLGVCGLRAVWVFIGVPFFPGSLTAVLSAYPIAWVITSILFFIYYFKGKWLVKGNVKID